MAIFNSRLSLAAFMIFLACSGCRSEMDPDQRAEAFTAYEAGVQSMTTHDYAAALERLTVAIQTGGLESDQYTDARLRRATCYVRLKQFDEAHKDLDDIEPFAANVEDVHVIRAFAYKQQGRGPAASSELAKARKVNPRIRPIEP